MSEYKTSCAIQRLMYDLGYESVDGYDYIPVKGENGKTNVLTVLSVDNETISEIETELDWSGGGDVDVTYFKVL